MPFILILFRGVCGGALQYKCSKNYTVGGKVSMKFNCSFCILQPQTEREWPTPEKTPVSSREVIFVPLAYNIFDAGLTVISFFLILLLWLDYIYVATLNALQRMPGIFVPSWLRLPSSQHEQHSFTPPNNMGFGILPKDTLKHSQR